MVCRVAPSPERFLLSSSSRILSQDEATWSCVNGALWMLMMSDICKGFKAHCSEYGCENLTWIYVKLHSANLQHPYSLTLNPERPYRSLYRTLQILLVPPTNQRASTLSVLGLGGLFAWSSKRPKSQALVEKALCLRGFYRSAMGWDTRALVIRIGLRGV